MRSSALNARPTPTGGAGRPGVRRQFHAGGGSSSISEPPLSMNTSSGCLGPGTGSGPPTLNDRGECCRSPDGPAQPADRAYESCEHATALPAWRARALFGCRHLRLARACLREPALSCDNIGAPLPRAQARRNRWANGWAPQVIPPKTCQSLIVGGQRFRAGRKPHRPRHPTLARARR